MFDVGITELRTTEVRTTETHFPFSNDDDMDALGVDGAPLVSYGLYPCFVTRTYLDLLNLTREPKH